MNAQALVKALGGRWCGSYGMVKCLSHADRTPSLKISDAENGDITVFCFAGCDWRDVKDALRRDGLLPAWRANSMSPSTSTPGKLSSKPRTRPDPEDAGRIALARRIWYDALPAAGTLVQTYLQGRGIDLSIPPTIRFAPDLRHTPTGMKLPTMVAAIQAPDRRVMGIHRTFLRGDGKDKVPFTKPRMMLGCCRQGAVRLAAAGPTLAIGEGIETCLTVMQESKVPTWAALSTIGVAGVILPPCVKEVILCPDGDGPGRDAARAAAHRFLSEGRRVRVARPPEGMDFNELLLEDACDG